MTECTCGKKDPKALKAELDAYQERRLDELGVPEDDRAWFRESRDRMFQRVVGPA